MFKLAIHDSQSRPSPEPQMIDKNQVLQVLLIHFGAEGISSSHNEGWRLKSWFESEYG
jgi:hypothetical protein